MYVLHKCAQTYMTELPAIYKTMSYSIWQLTNNKPSVIKLNTQTFLHLTSLYHQGFLLPDHICRYLLKCWCAWMLWPWSLPNRWAERWWCPSNSCQRGCCTDTAGSGLHWTHKNWLWTSSSRTLAWRVGSLHCPGLVGRKIAMVSWIGNLKQKPWKTDVCYDIKYLTHCPKRQKDQWCNPQHSYGLLNLLDLEGVLLRTELQGNKDHTCFMCKYIVEDKPV